jgi:hypothetical protein
MDTIYQKIDTGVLDAQEYKCNFFKLKRKSLEDNGTVSIKMEFWRILEDAQLNKPAYVRLFVSIPKEIADTFPTVSAAVVWCFTQSNLTATNEKIFTIQGATPI